MYSVNVELQKASNQTRVFVTEDTRINYQKDYIEYLLSVFLGTCGEWESALVFRVSVSNSIE